MARGPFSAAPEPTYYPTVQITDVGSGNTFSVTSTVTVSLPTFDSPTVTAQTVSMATPAGDGLPRVVRGIKNVPFRREAVKERAPVHLSCFLRPALSAPRSSKCGKFILHFRRLSAMNRVLKSKTASHVERRRIAGPGFCGAGGADRFFADVVSGRRCAGCGSFTTCAEMMKGAGGATDFDFSREGNLAQEKAAAEVGRETGTRQSDDLSRIFVRNGRGLVQQCNAKVLHYGARRAGSGVAGICYGLVTEAIVVGSVRSPGYSRSWGGRRTEPFAFGCYRST